MTVGIGQRLKARQQEVGISVKDLARASGLAASTVYDLLRGDSQSSTKLHALCKALGLNIDWVERQAGPRLAREAQPREHTFHGIALSVEAAQFAAEWDKLDEPARTQIRTMVDALGAQQVRSRRKGHKPDESSVPRRTLT